MFRREQIGLGWLGAMYAGEDVQGRHFRMIPLRRMNSALRDELQIRHRLLSGCSIPQAIPNMGIQIIHGTPYWLGAWKTGVQLSVVMQSSFDLYGNNEIPVSSVLYSIIESLIGAAQKGVVHGDLQPSCLWLTIDGVVWLDGYGQRESSEIPHRFSDMIYVAPEGSASSAGDVYSLGVILLELFLHRKPELYLEDASSHQKQVREYLQQCTAHPNLLQLVAKMLHYEAHKRPSLLEIVKHLRVSQASKMLETWLRRQYPSLYSTNTPEKMIPQPLSISESVPKPISLAKDVRSTQEVTEKEESGDIDFSIDFSDLGMIDLLGEYKFSPILEKDVEVVSNRASVLSATAKPQPSMPVAPIVDPIRHIFDEDAFWDKTQELPPAKVSMHHIVEAVCDTDEVEIDEDITLRMEDTVLEEKSEPALLEDSESTQALQMFQSFEEDFFTEDKTQQLFERASDDSVSNRAVEEVVVVPQNPWLIRVVFIGVGLLLMYVLYAMVFVDDVDFVKMDGVQLQQPTPVPEEVVVNQEAPAPITDTTLANNPLIATTNTPVPENTESVQTEETNSPSTDSVTTQEQKVEDITATKMDTQPKLPTPTTSVEKTASSQTNVVPPTPKSVVKETTSSSKSTEKKSSADPKNTKSVMNEAQKKKETNTTENPWGVDSQNSTNTANASVWDNSASKKSTNEAKKSTQEAPVMEDIWGASAPVESTPTKPPVPVKQYGTVIAVGDATKIRLHKDGQNYSAGKLETGTYQVYATFAGFGETKVGQVTVVFQQKNTISCDSTFVNCKITP